MPGIKRVGMSPLFRGCGKITPHRNKSMTSKLIPILAVATLVACCANAQPKMELKDLKQKASYSIGADIASNMKKQEIDIDVKSLTAGFSDAFAGGKMLLTDAEMKEVAERAGLGIGTIYRNFAAKEQLVEAIIESCIAEALEDILPIDDIADPAERIRALLGVAWKQAERNGALFAAIDAIPHAGSDQAPPPEIFARIVRHLSDGVSRGVLRAGIDPEFLAHYLAAQFETYIALRTRFPASAVQDHLTTLLLGALLSSPPATPGS